MKNTAKQSESVMRLLFELSQKYGKISLERDLGGNTLTVVIEGLTHFHVGTPDGSFDQMIEMLNQRLKEI